jgi:hypothetical protein
MARTKAPSAAAGAAPVAGGLDRWRNVLLVGGCAALASVVLTFVQVAIYTQWPPPETVAEAFALFAENPLLGLLSFDLLYIANNTAVLIAYLALFVVLRQTHPAATAVALLLASVGMAAYMASNVSFEMLAIADAYNSADGTGRVALLGAGEAMLAGFKGTAFDVYYVLNAIALFLFAGSMLRTAYFSRAIGMLGLAAAALMVVPSTAGAPGRVFALASLVPWVIFATLTGLRLLRLGR